MIALILYCLLGVGPRVIFVRGGQSGELSRAAIALSNPSILLASDIP